MSNNWQRGDILVFSADFWDSVYRKDSVLKAFPYEVEFIAYSSDGDTFSAICEGQIEEDFSIRFFNKKVD